jgi:hypothetical protein
LLGITTSITRKLIKKFILYRINKIVNESNLYLNNGYCKSNFSVHLLDIKNNKGNKYINEFYRNVNEETLTRSRVHGVQKCVYFDKDTFFSDFVVFVFDDKEQKIASIATFNIVLVELKQGYEKLYKNYSYNERLYHSGRA